MDITSFALKPSYCNKGAPQKSKSELCPYVCYDRCMWLSAFIGRADSQEDTPFSIAPFIGCCDSGVVSAKS